MSKLKDLLEYKGNNDALFTIVDVTEGYSPKAEVIVSENQEVFVVCDGVVQGPLTAGRHKLFEHKGILFWKKNKYKSIKVIFLFKTHKVTIHWGTREADRIYYHDPKIGIPIDVAAFGSMEFQIDDGKQFYQEIVAYFGSTYSTEDLQRRVQTKTLDRVTSAVRKVIQAEQLSYFDFVGKRETMQGLLFNELKDAFQSDFGLKLCAFYLENLNLSEENEQKICEQYQKVQDRVDAREQRAWEVEQDDWKKEDVERDLNFQIRVREKEEYVYNRDKQRERDDEEYRRQWEREKLDREARLAESAMRYDAVKEAGWENDSTKGSRISATGRYCKMCGTLYGAKDRHCSVCGAPTGVEEGKMACPVCNKVISKGLKYCSECGANLADDTKDSKK